jgi:hypothetical protein
MKFWGLLLCILTHPTSVTGAGESAKYARPEVLGTLNNPALREVSGMVPVKGKERCYWVHNDSGDKARIFAIHESGWVLAEVSVTGAVHTDWEDIAQLSTPAPPDPEGARGKTTPLTHLYIGDTGNNRGTREELVIYRIVQPDLSALEGARKDRPPVTIASNPATAIPFRYPDRRRDCEALVIHPKTGDIYLLTKGLFSADVYRLPAEPGDTPPGTTLPVRTVVKVATLKPGDPITAADLSTNGTRLVLRTYIEVYEYQIAEGTAFEQIFLKPQKIDSRPLPDAQSESVCYDHEGRNILTTSEGRLSRIYRLKAGGG